MVLGVVHALTPVCQVAGIILLTGLPAWGVLKSLEQDALLRFVGAIIAGFLGLYLLEFGAYLFSAPQWVALLSYFIICFVLNRVSRHSKSDSQGSFCWDGLLLWFGVTCWILALQSKIVTYGTVSWFGDWYEHYERSMFFFERWPPESRFLTGFWSLPARAPLFNANIAFLMNFFGTEFWSYQTLATALNTFSALPLALLIRDLANVQQKTAILLSLAICAVAPFAVIQETFTWTKFLSIGLTLAGIHLYVLGTRTRKMQTVFWSFIAFAAGMLTHYLVLLFALFFGFHFLYLAIRKKWEMKHAAVTLAISSALVLSWVVYVFLVFGVKETLTANSTFGRYASVKAANHIAPPWSQVFAGNIVTTFVPYSWRHNWKSSDRAPHIRQVQPLPGKIRIPTIFPLVSTKTDPKIECYSDVTANADSVTANVGWAGLAALIACLVWRNRTKKTPLESTPSQDTEPGKVFWSLFVIVGVPLNIFICRVYVPEGLAHINLQPFVCLLVVFLIGRLKTIPLSFKVLILLLFVAESAYTVHAILALQYMPVAVTMNGDQLQILGSVGLNQLYVANYIYKLQVQAQFLSDYLGRLTTIFSGFAALAGIACFVAIHHRGTENTKVD